MDPLSIIKRYYAPDSEAYAILVAHGRLVAGKALALASRMENPPDLGFVEEAALLHDIGIIHTHSPRLGCHGSEPYIRHGVIGRCMLEAIGLERHARICERHVGVGLTAQEIRCQGLPLPECDMLPETLEERLICYADKFFSKKVPGERSAEMIRSKLAGFGNGHARRFDELHAFFEAAANPKGPAGR